MGPAEFVVGEGIDVRPHPHINLATDTYLFGGEIMHRDSLGTEVAIHPCAVNWKTAGRGIVHSERTASQVKARGARLFGLNLGRDGHRPGHPQQRATCGRFSSREIVGCEQTSAADGSRPSAILKPGSAAELWAIRDTTVAIQSGQPPSPKRGIRDLLSGRSPPHNTSSIR